MATKKIAYPKSLKDIPLWRRREVTRDLLWFSKYSATERLDFTDREWLVIQDYIQKFGIQKNGTGKRSRTFRLCHHGPAL